ncbi:MAG: hypothetical protein JSV91_13950 [Phycisphaerales bacterium]|nr:MAG: hypothetical protein JSV91_13950 [Phycisphaerales bacterium]
MGAFLGISLWIALATVVPGLVTIAVVYGAFVVVGTDAGESASTPSMPQSEWILAAIAITIMVLTQAAGILLEEVLVRARLLGSRSGRVPIPREIKAEGVTEEAIDPYREYRCLYFLLAQLREDDDSQGHLKRALAQFFLTNNTLISFSAGIITTIVLLLTRDGSDPAGIVRGGGLLYLLGLAASLVISYLVARIRFRVMAKALWAARTIRAAEAKKPPNAG